MRTQMNKILAAISSVIFLITTVGGVKCYRCKSVERSNICSTFESTCETRGYCGVLRESRGGTIIRVARLCFHVCRRDMSLREQYTNSVFCCQTDFCNDYSPWQ